MAYYDHEYGLWVQELTGEAVSLSVMHCIELEKRANQTATARKLPAAPTKLVRGYRLIDALKGQ